MRKYLYLILSLIIITASVVIVVLWLHTSTRINKQYSIAMIEHTRCTSLTIGSQSMTLTCNIDDRDSIVPFRYFDIWQPATTDTLYTPAVWVNRWALFPSCKGRLITPVPYPTLGSDSLYTATHLRREQALYKAMLTYYQSDSKDEYTLSRHIDEQQREIDNLKYYLRVHGVQDEGYHDIKQHEQILARQLNWLKNQTKNNAKRIAHIKRCLSILSEAIKHPSTAHFTTHSTYRAIYKNGKTTCTYKLDLEAERTDNGYLLLQRTDKTTPADVNPISITPWTHSISEEYYVTSYGSLYTRYAMHNSQPCIKNKLRIDLIGKTAPKGYTGYWLSRQNNGTIYAGNIVKGVRQGNGLIYYPDSMEILGKFCADTINYGTYQQRNCIYTGEMNRHKQASGHGTMRYAGCRMYSGRWTNGQKEGFGYQTGLNMPLQLGEWHADSYRGERLTYTSDRIYGIDISRFQHEQGKKKYGIDWNNLRISHLGTSSRKRINGQVDYPISFIYIKATEGTSIRNRYYTADYTQAKRHGIHTGSYHFFSTTTSGTTQAQYFLRYAHIQKGDLPPVLDVEPSAAQIKRMGGPTALWREVRAWLQTVKTHTHVSPVLYISQMFVNNYLPYAPDMRRNHHVWIARYGEYKPDVRLAYWQLCPDGRVSGIKGEVDINVFNGYKDEFRLFLEQNCIR